MLSQGTIRYYMNMNEPRQCCFDSGWIWMRTRCTVLHNQLAICTAYPCQFIVILWHWTSESGLGHKLEETTSCWHPGWTFETLGDGGWFSFSLLGLENTLGGRRVGFSLLSTLDTISCCSVGDRLYTQTPSLDQQPVLSITSCLFVPLW